jgi:hypothetical protein
VLWSSVESLGVRLRDHWSRLYTPLVSTTLLHTELICIIEMYMDRSSTHIWLPWVCCNKSQIPLISVQLRSEFDSVQAVLEHLDIWAVDSSTVCTLYSGVRIVKITKPANMKPVIYAWRHPPAAPAAPAFKALRRKLSDRKRSKLAAQKRRGFPPLRTWQEQDSVQGDDCGDICVLTRTSTMETTDTSPSSPRQSSLRAQILRRIGAVLGINSRVLPTNTVDAY